MGHRTERNAISVATARFLAVLAASAVVGACATVPERDGLPQIHYARNAAIGGVVAATTRRPTEADVRASEILWKRGLGEALACGQPRLEVVRTAIAGAAELATMSAVAKDGDGRVDDALLKRFGRDLMAQLLSPGARPHARRCRVVAQWSARVRDDGQEAIGRAIAKGFLPLL